MQIKINKDLEEEYRDELIRGFSLREAIYIAIGMGAIGGVTALLYFRLGTMPDTGIYIGLPFGAPAFLMGFYRYQGLTLPSYLKERLYAWQTRLLAYDADELPKECHVFTMERKRKGRMPWEKWEK